MRNPFLILLTCILFSGAICAQKVGSAGEMEIMMKMLSLKNALVAKDSAGLRALLSDDASYGHSNGLVQTRSELIRSVMSGEQDYKKIEPSGMEIRFYEQTAIVTLQSKVTMVFKGKPLELNMKILLVWINKTGSWKLVARQSASIAN